MSSKVNPVYFYNHPDSIFRSPLHHAAGCGDDASIKASIQNGENLNATNYLGRTALSLAIEFNHPSIVQLLLENGVDANAKSGPVQWTPLQLAASKGNSAAVDLLLQAGANPDVKMDYSGSSPLLLAVLFAKGDHAKKIATSLIQKGANVNLGRFGYAPLRASIDEGNLELAELLVLCGADVNASAHGGWTPLHQAAFKGHQAAVELLFQRGADPTLLTEDSETAYDVAVRKGQTHVANWLKKTPREQFTQLLSPSPSNQQAPLPTSLAEIVTDHLVPHVREKKRPQPSTPQESSFSKRASRDNPIS